MNVSSSNFRLTGLVAAASLALAGCATGSGSGYGSAPSSPGYGNSTSCYDCGTVTRIEQVGGGGQAPAATGAVLGGLVGAAAGRELGKNESTGRRNSATVAGAVAGAVAGNAIQRNVAAPSYNVHVRMNDGRTTVITQSDLGGIREGGYVRVYDGRAWVR